MKICNKCKVEKDESEFSKDKSRKDGLYPQCNKCNKKYYNENKENINNNRKIYYKNNKNKILEKVKKYCYNNKDKIKERKKNYRISHKKEANEWRKNKRKLSNSYKLRCYFSSKISNALKKQNSSKFGESCLKYLQYTINKLKQHLESQFETWMNWDNYGKANLNKKTWNIDHIIPQSLLPYNSMEDENFRKCWALENLRPMEAIDNIKKSNKI